MIPKKMMAKYNLPSFDDWQTAIDTGAYNGFLELYQMFLNKTDHIPLKLIEGAISAADIAGELKYREIARQEIAKISGQPYEPRENQKTLDERTEAAEANIDYIALMADIEIPTEA